MRSARNDEEAAIFENVRLLTVRRCYTKILENAVFGQMHEHGDKKGHGPILQFRHAREFKQHRQSCEFQKKKKLMTYMNWNAT